MSEFIHTGEPTPAGPDAAASTPESVSRRQLREWLIDHDLFATVEAILDGIPETKARQKALNWWDETLYRRDHPLVEQLGEALEMTPEQIDAAFIAASLL